MYNPTYTLTTNTKEVTEFTRLWIAKETTDALNRGAKGQIKFEPALTELKVGCVTAIIEAHSPQGKFLGWVKL